MGREHPFTCEHGVKMGGDESFGVQDNRCAECDATPTPFEVMENRIKELESRIKTLLTSSQSWEAVAADKQVRIEELEGENAKLTEKSSTDTLRVLIKYANMQKRAEKAESKLEAVREYKKKLHDKWLDASDENKARLMSPSSVLYWALTELSNIIKEKA